MNSPIADHSIAQFLACLPQPAYWLDGDLNVLQANGLADASARGPLHEVLGVEAAVVAGLKDASNTAAQIELDRGNRQFRLHGKANVNETGAPRYLVTLDEVTELTEQRYRCERMVEHSLACFWEIDPAGATTFVNPAMATLLGYSAEEMTGKLLFDFMDDEAKKTCLVNMSRRASGISEHHEFRLRHKDGTDVWTLMATSPYRDSSGEHVGSLAVVTDANEKHVLERKISEAQRLESLTVLASGVAHDFNNILVAIIGNAEMGQAECDPDSRFDTYFAEICTAGRRAADLSRQMLAYAGGGPMVIRPISINRLVNGMQDVLRTTANDVRLVVELGQEQTWASLDLDQARQVLLALVANAAEACAGNSGRVTLRTGSIEATEDFLAECRAGAQLLPGNYCYVDVNDTGCGIGTSILPKIFDPFFSTKFVGRGLGLAAVHGLLKAHGAGLHMTTEVGTGTRVRVLFARVVAPTEKLPISTPSAGITKLRGKVLVVDDEPLVLTTIRIILKSQGYQCELCASGEAALKAYDAAPNDFSLAIIDLTMPGMSGLEVCEALRDRAAKMPLIVSSGYHVEDNVDQDFVFLQKPYSPNELKSVLQLVVASAVSTA